MLNLIVKWQEGFLQNISNQIFLAFHPTSIIFTIKTKLLKLKLYH